MSADELAAGLGDAATFRRRMLDRLPLVEVDADGMVSRPLATLRRDVASDPTIALIDAYAQVADILSFYQDRILNEGYLPTALDPSSLALFGQGLSVDAAIRPSASVELAVFAQPGGVAHLPAGTAFQASARRTAGEDPAATTTPTFLSDHAILADPALNQLTPFQTRAPNLDPADTSLLLAGTGLGLSSGDALLLVRAGPVDEQWVRLTVHSTTENVALGTTTVAVGAPLLSQWIAGGASGPFPAIADAQLYALHLACRLFGYNAPKWSQQPLVVRRAALPPSLPPSAVSEWPGFAIDPADLHLQAVYPRVLPGDRFVLETPETLMLGTVAAVARDNPSMFGMTGQATRITPAAGTRTQPAGLALNPARRRHSVTLLADGRALIVGGIGAADGRPIVLRNVEIHDPATGLTTPLAPLPAARGAHTATLLDGKVIIAGGVTDGFAWARGLLVLDPVTLTFAVAGERELAIDRIDHAATALPDGTLLISGGAAGTLDLGKPGEFEALRPTPSVLLVSAGGALMRSGTLAAPRAGHSADLCPVTPTAGGASLGQVVVFVGGRDEAAPRADIELGSVADGLPLGELWPIHGASARSGHVTVSLPANDGLLVTGGIDGTGAVADNWFIAVTAVAGADGLASEPRPYFAPAPPFASARGNHAAALLPDGVVIAASGENGPRVLGSAERFEIAAGVPIATDAAQVVVAHDLAAALPAPQSRAAFAALANGELLITGGITSLPDRMSAAVVAYDATVRTVALVSGPQLPPDTIAPTASIALADGTILLLGSPRPPGFPASGAAAAGYAWIFDPATGSSTETGSPIVPRLGATLSLLDNGTVLVAGGIGLDRQGYAAALGTAELYDPATRSFRALGGAMISPRFGHSATTLRDGSVLLIGGYALPPVTYDERGLGGAYLPARADAEIYSASGQGFRAVATPLPVGVGFHAANLLANGDVLITGGASDCWTLADFTIAWATPVTQAVRYELRAQGFAAITPMATARAHHAAALLPDGRVLITGGSGNVSLSPTAACELFDPSTNRFARADPLAAPRRGHAIAPIAQGLLVVGGGDSPSYELRDVDGSATVEGLYALPISLPAPDWPQLAVLGQAVTAIPVADHGVYAFGGGAGSGDGDICLGALFVTPGPAPDRDARRQAMVYTQSRALSFASPIDTAPVTGAVIEIDGIVEGLTIGKPLLIAGRPPLARTVGAVIAAGVPLVPGTIVMPLSPLAEPGAIAEAALADRTHAGLHADPRTAGGLSFMSGNGGAIGNIPAAVSHRFDRPTQAELAAVRAIEAGPLGDRTRVTLDRPLGNYYDRTATVVYGNVVRAVEGIAVIGELLGSGDGEQPFQRFLLSQAPLAWGEDAAGVLRPQLTVRVAGEIWDRVTALGGCAGDARVYQLQQDAAGRALIQFGDGIHGRRLPTHGATVVADYRIGSGDGGNVPAGSLTRPPAGAGGIKGTLNPLPATGGFTPSAGHRLRAAIPRAVQDLGRIVTHADMVSFLQNRPEVGQAALTLVQDDTEPATRVALLTVADPNNVPPDRRAPAFRSLDAAFRAARAAALDYRLLPFTAQPFKLAATLHHAVDTNPFGVRDAADEKLRAHYMASRRQLGEPVRASDIERLLRGVPGVEAAMVTALWLPPNGPSLVPALRPQPATLEDGAGLLVLSADSDAVALTLSAGPPIG